MLRSWFGISIVGLCLFATAIGVVAGVRALPPSETEIINAAAARYVAETGGALTDCYARPSGLSEVRLVVICETEAGVWLRGFDRLGREVGLDAEVLEGAQT